MFLPGTIIALRAQYGQASESEPEGEQKVSVAGQAGFRKVQNEALTLTRIALDTSTKQMSGSIHSCVTTVFAYQERNSGASVTAKFRHQA